MPRQQRSVGVFLCYSEKSARVLHKLLGEIIFPGDPEVHPANVYNCRCTTAAKVMGFEGKSNKNHLTLMVQVV